MSDLARFQHPRFARMFLGAVAETDRRGGLEHRRRLLAGLRGSVVEIGAGPGGTFALYPATVTRVLAVEPDDTLRAAALAAAGNAPVPVEVVAGHAGALPAGTASADAAVVSLVLCSVPDVGAALAEIRRILRPGGELRYYEHVRSTPVLRRALESALTPVWSRLAGGCHLDRATPAAIRAAGFAVRSEERFRFRAGAGEPALTHVLGVAVAP